MNVRSYFILICALLPLALASCSSDEEAQGQPVRQQLTFDVGSSGQQWATRGTPLNELDSRNYVGLFCTDYDASQASPEVTMMMYNELTFYAGSVWSTSYAYFVPETTHRMRFYAYYPRYDNVGPTGEVIRMSDTTEVVTPSFDYITPTKAEDQLDLMFAVSDEVQSKYVSGALKMDPVKLRFHHLLAALNFTVTSKVSGTVTKIELSRVKYQARFAFDGNAANDWAQIHNEATDPSKTVWQNFGIRVGVSESPIIITEDPEVFMLLPQTLGEDNIVKLTFQTGGGEYVLQKALPAGTVLSKGCKTTVNVAITSLKQIELTVTNPAIIDWNNTNINGEASDNTGIDPLPGVDPWADNTGGNWDTTPTD